MSAHVMGDTGFLVLLPGAVDAALLARVRILAADLTADRLAGVGEIVPAYGSIGITYEPENVPTPRGELPWRVVADWLERHLAGKGPTAARKARAARTHVFPCCYGGEFGPDLEHVAKVSKRSTDEVVKLHSGADYLVAAIGFTPGFPYLLGLPEVLATPRRTTPRLRVPAGSVAIGAAQTGIYPRETPGGWQLIGRTARELFDPTKDAPALLAAGDVVKFKAVEKQAFAAPNATTVGAAGMAPAERADGATRNGASPAEAESKGASASERDGGGETIPAEAFVEVVKAGTLTTVQDLGRRGFAAVGLGIGGALDPWAAAVANLAVGNLPGAALLECTYVGPVLRFAQGAVVALSGAEVAGRGPGRPLNVEAGEVLDCSALTRGARLYIAFAGGGVRVPSVLGGTGTVVGAHFGGWAGRALVAGDRLPLGPARSEKVASTRWSLGAPVPPPARKATVEVRLIPGPDWARIFQHVDAADAVRAVEARRYQLSAKSDRMGLRLQGEAFTVSAELGDQTSRPVVPGTVQLPPDGQPIVLMAEGQTIGGYAQLGQVASIDLPLLAQARPGAEIVFRVTDITTAQQARMRVASDLARLRVGLAMLR